MKPGVRRGILPGILAALMSARSSTRAQLKQAQGAAARAVLDSRQKALKVGAGVWDGVWRVGGWMHRGGWLGGE